MAYECPLIEISGSPYERGVMYGQKAHDRIIKGVAHYSQQLNASDFGADQLAKIVSKIVPLIESFNTKLVAEMRGRFDVVLVLLSHLDATRESILKQIVDLQQQSGGAVLVIAQRMDARATISVLQLGVEAVLSGDLPMRRLYRRIAFHLQRQRARPIHVAALTASPTV